MFSDDFGLHWNISRSPLPHGDECTIAAAPNGSLLMNMRTALKWRQFSSSSDRGSSWSTPSESPNP